MTSVTLNLNLFPPQIDHFSSLPNELLDHIFEHAYKYSPPSHPLSKRLLPFFDRHFYRNISLTSLSQFDDFAAAINRNPTKRHHVRSLILPDESQDCRLHFEPQLLQILPLLPNLNSLRFPYSPALLSSGNTARSSPYLTRLEFLETALSIDEIRTVDLDPFSSLSTLPALNSLRIYDWDAHGMEEVNQTVSMVLRGVISLELKGIGVDTETIEPLVDACPSLLHLELDCPWYEGTMFEQCLPFLPATLSSLHILADSANAVPLDPFLTRFSQLKSLRLPEFSYSPDIHLTLLQLPLLVSVHLDEGRINSVGFESLVAGPSRLSSLQTITLEWNDAERGHKISRVSSDNFDPVSELARCSVDMVGWALPFEDDLVGSEVSGMMHFVEMAEENGVELRGAILVALETVTLYHIESNNRAILFTYVHHTLDHLRKARLDAARDGVDLPPLDLDSLDFTRLEIVEIDVAGQDWFMLSLRNKE